MTEINVDDAIAKISKKSGEEISVLTVAFEELKGNITPGAQQDYKALKELNKKYAVGKSPAVVREVIILSISDTMDFTRKRRTEAIEAYNADAESAITSGVVKMDGDEPIPLDTRQKFNNGNENKDFGKPLLPSLNRHCVAIVKTEDGAYVRRDVDLRGKFTEEESLPERNVLLKARLLGDLEDKPLHTSDKVTAWEEISRLEDDLLGEIIQEACKDNIFMLGDCLEYHNSLPEKTPEFYNRLVITSGTVSYVRVGEGEMKDGRPKNHFIVLDDPTVEKAISCFMPQSMDPPAAEDDITVLAQTTLGKGWDSKANDGKGAQTDEDVVSLNINGVINS